MDVNTSLNWLYSLHVLWSWQRGEGKQSQVRKGSSDSCFRLWMYWAQDAISSPRSPWHSPWHSFSGYSRPSLDLSHVAASSLDAPQWSGNKGQRKARAKRQRSQSRTWAKIINRAGLLSKKHLDMFNWFTVDPLWICSVGGEDLHEFILGILFGAHCRIFWQEEGYIRLSILAQLCFEWVSPTSNASVQFDPNSNLLVKLLLGPAKTKKNTKSKCETVAM